jgi:AcrR family transcriptional regulator
MLANSNICFKLSFMPLDTQFPSPIERRLLEAAGEVFAEKGYRAATIRQIIQRAGANVAAVNYHFGGKAELYAATIRYTRRTAERQHPIADSQTGTSAEERLHAFVRGLLFRVMDTGRPAWQWRLMMREMTEPTAALDEMVRDSIAPNFEVIAGIVCELTGLSRDDPRLSVNVNSIVGQILFYRHCQPVICRLQPQRKFDAQELMELAQHITDFSLQALTQSPAAKRSLQR